MVIIRLVCILFLRLLPSFLRSSEYLYHMAIVIVCTYRTDKVEVELYWVDVGGDATITWSGLR